MQDVVVCSGREEIKGSQSPSIVVLDLGLPGMDGYQTLKELWTFSDVPVI